MTGRSSIYCVALAGALAVAAFPAHAADLSGPSYKDAPYASVNWTGFYIGANGGYASDAWGTHGGIADNGGFGGGQIGYNWQGALGISRMLVLGAEADFQGTGIDHSGNGTLTWPSGLTHNDSHQRSIPDFGTVRGRVGIALERTLFYFTGGFAYGSEKNSILDLSTQKLYKSDGTHPGYVLGGGVEYKFSPAWSLKAEYQFIDLDNDRPVDSTGGYVITKNTELNTFRGGINYHFNSPLDPLK